MERKTMAQVIRDGVDTYLAADLNGTQRDRVLTDTFGSFPRLAGRVPSREDWDRGLHAGR